MVDLIDAIGEPATLELLAEECTELAQAALKTARVKRGENPTPVSIADALDHLAEEMADVELVMSALYIWNGDLSTDVSRWKFKKKKRMRERFEWGEEE